MKIGIVTFWDSEDNYGQILQAFALYNYVVSKGHDCFILKYHKSNETTIISKLFTGIKIITNPLNFFKLVYSRFTNNSVSKCQENRGFDEFRRRKLFFSKSYTKKQLFISPPSADAFICGSDQIWGGEDAIMYLDFVSTDCKKIAFAPSFGGLTPNPYLRCKIRRYLRNFDFVSCRENSGVELCKSLGRDDAMEFPDPTLMFKSYFYDSIVDETKEEPPYIYVYLLGNQFSFDVETISKFASYNNLKLKFVTGQNGTRLGIDSYPATIEEWILGIKKAEYVITNSFHGTVFSLLYHKKFITIPLTGIHSRMNVRINDLLRHCNLLDRVYSGDLQMIKKNIDYSSFDNWQTDCICKVNRALKGLI